MQAAPAHSFEAMQATGQSREWIKYKSNVMRILVLMLAVINDPTSTHPLKGVYPRSFDAFTPDMGCTERIYGLFATWLAEEYDTSDGKADPPTFLSPDVAVAYLRALIHTGKAKFSHIDDRARLFFTCVDAQSTSAKALWLKGLINNMHRTMCQRVSPSQREKCPSAT